MQTTQRSQFKFYNFALHVIFFQPTGIRSCWNLSEGYDTHQAVTDWKKNWCWNNRKSWEVIWVSLSEKDPQWLLLTENPSTPGVQCSDMLWPISDTEAGMHYLCSYMIKTDMAQLNQHMQSFRWVPVKWPIHILCPFSPLVPFISFLNEQELSTLQSLDLIKFYDVFIVFMRYLYVKNMRYVYVIKHAGGF